MIPNMQAKIRDFISEAGQTAAQYSVAVQFQPFHIGFGVHMTYTENSRNDPLMLDEFCGAMARLADEANLPLQVSFHSNYQPVKVTFQNHGFGVLDNSMHLQMERQPHPKVAEVEMQFESAPPGDKAERFIRHNKSSFKKRYGKRWKQVLYGRAWKQFGESLQFKTYFALVEQQNP
jgi:hypothetical protein